MTGDPQKVNKMTATQARVFAKTLFNEGKQHQEIADALKEKGYLSRLGKPLSRSGVNQMLLNAGKRRHRARSVPTKAPPAPKTMSDKSSAVRQILLLKGMDSDERIALALLVLGDKE